MNQDAINQRILTIESELAELKAELNKPDKFKFKYEFSNTYNVTGHTVVQNCTGEINDALQNFRYRQTEANAKADFQLQKELMCIGALAEQIDPDYKSKIYADCGSMIYSIYKDNYTNIFKTHNTYYSSNRRLGVVYMPKDVAEKVCEILNNKGVEL